jgi:hypothetical protein
MIRKDTFVITRIWNSYITRYERYQFLVYNTALSVYEQTFRRNISATSSGQKSAELQAIVLAYGSDSRVIVYGTYGAISQMTASFASDIIWRYMMSCGSSKKNRPFGGMYRLHLQVMRLWMFSARIEDIPHDERRREPLATVSPQLCFSVTVELLLMDRCFVECVLVSLPIEELIYG